MSLLSGRRNTNIGDYLGIQLNFLQDFFMWWYVDIPTYILGVIRRVNTVLLDATSLLIIITGFFKPWKNDYNIAGWMVGIVLKIIYIPLAGFLLLVANFFLISWLLSHLIFLPLIIAMIVLNPFLAP